MKLHFLTTIFFSLFFIDLNAQIISLVKDLNPGNLGTQLAEFRACNGQLYFTTFGTKQQLWKTNGDSINTILLKDFFGLYPRYGLTCLNNQVYFVAGDTTNGFELWTSDGTTQGTSIVKDINPGASNAFDKSRINNSSVVLQVLNNKLYFVANDGTHGRELWESDGTSVGTKMVIDIKSSHLGFDGNNGIHTSLGLSNNKLFFGASDDLDTFRLWVSDGTAAGTYALNNTQPISYTDNFITFNGDIYYTGSYLHNGYIDFGLLKTDGTEPGTELLLPNGMDNLFADYAILNNKLYFIGRTTSVPSTQHRIYMTDGTPQGTGLLKDSLSFPILPAIGVYNPKLSYLTVFNNKIYFSNAGDTATQNYLLWQSDGTPSGTQPLKISQPNLKPTHLISANGKLYFKGRDSTRVDIWETDGNVLTKIQNPSTNIFSSTLLFANNELSRPVFYFNNELFYGMTYQSAIGLELYKLNFTPSAINENLQDNHGLIVFPNPTHDFIEISVDQIDKMLIHDVSGKRLIESNEKRIDIRDITPGIYFLTIYNKEQILRAKFIKQ